ncbi:type I restriction enzyme HsdR N-terminal domain-containing protein [Xanthomonas hortorum]|uniref:type I restriction enzyme HsdR N-terminal domain-containing protein n=1 Tax=Xanthomonas hortorum TaxID=56454 RepID=UPI0015931D22|nr:type I restriction enzyme HsdR N-terminal domain-containing protein [Xanthomonas hortorum]NHF68424.1 type I restriction enzyme HsdR N-terminal domain-containing protein [Xanthomonas hortorum]
MTDQNNEADLESRIDATLAQIFPGVELKHQRRFTVRVGHNVLEKSTRDYVTGRADVLVERDGKPLAVLELKRAGLPLTADDEDQGWSYAALVMAPLVVISNGADTRILRTHDRVTLSESSLNASELAQRLQFAASSAEASVTNAIERLLGTDLGLPATQAINNFELNDLSGNWIGRRPFVEDFLVPRTATDEVRSILQADKYRAVLVSGAPLCGKSSVLRELVTTKSTTEGIPVYIEGSACTEGLFRRLSNVLSAEFGWAATPDQTRAWLRQIASDPKRPLMLCIDAPSTSEILRTEIDEILSGAIGKVRLVLGVDEAELDEWRISANRRYETRLGRNSKVVTVGPYSDDEFGAARARLVELGGHLVHGSSFSPELRVPWVLRAAVAPKMEAAKSERFAVLPPTLGPETICIAEQRFEHLGDLRDALESVARAYLDFIVSSKSEDLALASIYDFFVQRDWLRDHVDRDDINALIRAGILQSRSTPATGTLYYVRLPPLFAAAIVERLYASVEKKLSGKKDFQVTARWLVARCSRMPFGDAIGAAVVHRLMVRAPNAAAVPLLNALLKMEPTIQALTPGVKLLTKMPSLGTIELEMDEDNNLLVRKRNDRSRDLKIKLDDQEMPTMADQSAWLILSQIPPFNIFGDFKRQSQYVKAAAAVLMEVGKCPAILHRPRDQLDEYHTLQVGTVQVPCPGMGMVEPVTWAITETLLSTAFRDERDAWVRVAAESGSVPLLARATQALQHLMHIEGHAEWAETVLNDYCQSNWKSTD